MESHGCLSAAASRRANEPLLLSARRGDAYGATAPASQPAPKQAVRPTRFFRWKIGVERVAAGTMLLAALPLIGLLALLTRATSRGPGIYRQLRVGLHGKPYWMYKIRTMVDDAEGRTGPVWTSVDDPRITPLGRWLRRLHLDELPQLWNVVCGEMSLCGPRPERPEIVPRLARSIPGYLERLSVRPGITGLAQLNLPSDVDLNSVRRKLVLDLEYITTADWSMDARIIACSLLRVFGMGSRRARQVFGLLRQVELPEVHPQTEQPAVQAMRKAA